jgi:oligoribonuclease NrnB/cAMP/cGMP phosphodiesterase (DHH superfamily)
MRIEYFQLIDRIVALSAAERTIDVEAREVYIIDFSFDRKVMEWMFEKAKRVVWLDHHKTAFEMWLKGTDFESCGTNRQAYETYGGKNKIVLHPDKSGAYLAWEYFHPGTEVPMLIKHIDDYDRWQFKFDGTKAFNKALWSYAPWSFEQWNNFIFDHFYTQGEAILRAHDQNVQSVVKGASRKCFITNEIKPLGWVHGLAANCPPHLTSDVGHELANQSGTFGLCWTLSKEGMKAQCSLRSNGDYDVSAIAKVFGGGGHKNAAGFEVPLSTLIGWLK